MANHNRSNTPNSQVYFSLDDDNDLEKQLEGSASAADKLGMYPPTPRVSPKGIDDIALSQIRDDRRLLSNYSDDDDLEDPFRTDRSEIIKLKIFKILRHPAFLIMFLFFMLFLIVIVSMSGFEVDKPHPVVPGNFTVSPPTKDDRFRFGFNNHYSLYASSSNSKKFVTTATYKDGSYIQNDHLAITIKHLEYKDETTVCYNADISYNGKTISYRDFEPSCELDYILLNTNLISGWRHSFFADYFIHHAKSKTTAALTTSTSNKTIPNEIGSGKVSLAKWSPKGNNIAWVRDNDLYVSSISLKNGKVSVKEVQITMDGSKDTINGIADWVYEEEVLASHSALWFSPDGSTIAYLKFNESQVPEYTYPLYEKDEHGTPYPRQISVKYPKPGFPNPTATLHITTPFSSEINVASGDSLVQFAAGDIFEDVDTLFVELKWLTKNDTLLVRVMNRVQDHQKIFLVNPIKRSNDSDTGVIWNATLVRDEPSKDGAWFNNLQPVSVMPFDDSETVSTKKSQPMPGYLELMEDATGYQHIAYFKDITSAEPSSWLTGGKFEITEIKGIDTQKIDNPLIYYISTEEDSTQRHLYSIKSNAYNKTKLTPPTKITYEAVMPFLNYTDDELSSDVAINKTVPILVNGTLVMPDPPVVVKAKLGEIGYYDAQFTPKCKYYVLDYKGPDVPFTKVINTGDSAWQLDLIRNDATRDQVGKYNLPITNFLKVKNEAGQGMNLKMTFPPGFSIYGDVKYPVLMKVYGGPNSQSVEQTYGFDFMTSIADSGFIAVIVDGRGTGFKGREYRSCVSKNLGKFEVDDQIYLAKWLSGKPYIDKKRIAIWGWSYGGYMSSKVLEADSGYISLAMAVAPVTDWRYYDTVYTERYMKTPDQNKDGYSISSVTKMSGFLNNDFLLIQGTSDDNVHFQNSADLVYKLTAAHVRRYRVQYFTDNDHSISNGGANVEVFDLLKRFLFEKFNIDERIEKRSLIRRLFRRFNIFP